MCSKPCTFSIREIAGIRPGNYQDAYPSNYQGLPDCLVWNILIGDMSIADITRRIQ